MNILWLSWRDIKNPQRGGAEIFDIENATRLHKNGFKVTIFTSYFRNAKANEKIKGVKIIRKGNLITCRFYAFIYYLKHNNFDIIIDEINTIPFFSIFYAKKKTLPIIHQLAKEFWFSHTIWPINIIGHFLEPIWLSFYKNMPTIVVSSSTKKDLTKLNFNKIKILKIGLNFKPHFSTNKDNLIVFIGRIVKAKGVEDAIFAFKAIHDKLPMYKLKITGRGNKHYTQKLKSLSKTLGLETSVQFTDYISENKKIALLQKSKITLIPSIREGWGIVATESNALCSVPIAYNIPGLKDAILNGQTGLLVKRNPNKLAEATIALLKNDLLWNTLAKNGYENSKKYNWNNCYLDFNKIIVDLYKSMITT